MGTGNPVHGDIGWRAAGRSFADRGRRTDESLRVLPALVTGEPAVLEDGLEVTLSPGSAMPPVPRATVVGPALDADPGKAAAQLAAYAEAGTERVILSSSGDAWQRDYERAGELIGAL